MYGAKCGVVNSAARLLPYQSHLVQHLETVADDVDLAALVVVPAHGDLFQIQTGAKREVQQFHIETKAVHRCCFNEGPAHAHTKRLEATLRVPERQTCREAYDEVENTSALFAPPRLVNTDQAAIERARSECHVALSFNNRLDQFWCFADRSGKIGVRKKSYVAPRGEQSEPDGPAFSEIRFVTEDRGT